MANQFIQEYFIAPPEKGRVQFFRSIFVGILATAADIGTLIILKEFTSLADQTLIATTLAFIVGLIANYLMSTFWAFRNQNSTKRSTEFIVFCVISAIGLVLNDAIVLFFQKYLAYQIPQNGFLPRDKYYIIGKLVATILVFVWNFGMRKILLYRGKCPSNSKPS